MAGDAGLNERRVGNGTGGDIGFLVVHGAGNVDRNKLGCALTIGGDIARQALAHLVHGKCQLAKGIGALDDRLGICGSGAGGKHDAGVVGRGVGIDRYLVKGLLDGREQQGMKCRRLDGGIGGDNCNHGGHVGHDHARALAHSAYRIDIARMTRGLTDVGHGVLLGVRVGRHDGASGIGATVG